MTLTDTNRWLARALIGAAIAAATAAPGASADPGALQYQNLRSPHAHDAVELASPQNTRELIYCDLRSPDARDAASNATRQDALSPDARDAPDGYRRPLESLPVASEPISPSRFDWVSAAIGAAVGVGLLIVIRAASLDRRKLARAVR